MGYTEKPFDPEETLLNEPSSTYGQKNLITMASMTISKMYIKHLLDLTHLSVTEMMNYLPISIDTYKRKTEFNPPVTEKILEIQEVYEKGLEAFGEDFYHWMGTTNVSLGNITPKSLLANSFGIRRLLEEIGRIEHGVLA